MAEIANIDDPVLRAYQDLNAEFLDMVGALSVLRSLSTISLTALTEPQLIARGLDVLMRNQDLERCSVFLLQGDQLVNAGGLDWSDLIGAPRSDTAARVFRLGEGLLGLAAQTGELQHSRNCATDPRFVSGNAVGSLIAVPIGANDTILGVLNVSHPHTEFFSVGHERALVVFANFLGQMLVTRRLLAQMDHLVQERTQMLEHALADAVALKRRYAEMSTVDELTGLYNRRHFFPAARAALARALRSGTPFSVVLLDIDHFKHVNDTYGHAGGDQALSQFAGLLREECREADALARFGGEEFIIALPDTDSDGARVIAERIRLAAKAWRGEVNERTMHFTVSLGIACIQTNRVAEGALEKVLEQLISEADQALYYSKHHGRDQSCLYRDIAADPQAAS